MRIMPLIGLLLLAVGLVVVTSPTALATTAGWVETGAVKAGLIEPPDPLAGLPDDVFAEGGEEAVETALLVRGHTTTADGDIVDAFDPEARAGDVHRLAAGATRAYLPGQRKRTGRMDAPPVGAAGRMRLDDIGCPVIDVSLGLDAVVELFADEAYVELEEAAIGELDEAGQATCELRRAEATALLLEDTGQQSPEAQGRQVAQLGGLASEAIWVTAQLRFAEALGMVSVDDAVAESAVLVGEEAPADAAAGGAGAAATGAGDGALAAGGG